MNGVDALVKIARAQQRGTLPKAMSVAYHAPFSVTLSLSYSWNVRQTLDDYGTVLVWLRQNFPEGRDRLTGRTSHWNRRYQHPRSVWVDWRDYQTASGLVQFSYPVSHECREFKADTRDANERGVPKWTCVACPKRLTVTEARRRGLLPSRESLGNSLVQA